MFEKFGEMNSAAEINDLADNLLNEGDLESLEVMARENGIQMEYIMAYQEGEIPFLCDDMVAALGKIDVEEKELKPQEIMQDWTEYLKAQCMENEELARCVRQKGKNLKGIRNVHKTIFCHLLIECAFVSFCCLFAFNELVSFHNNIRRVNLPAISVCIASRLQSAFNQNFDRFSQILFDKLGALTECHTADEIRFIIRFIYSQCIPGYKCSFLRRSDFRIPCQTSD